jgi:hypothetical protein
MPEIVTGAQRLFQDLLRWLLVLIPLAGGAMIAWHSVAKLLSDGDPGTVADCNRKIKQVIVGVIIGMSASGIVSAAMAYFT